MATPDARSQQEIFNSCASVTAAQNHASPQQSQTETVAQDDTSAQASRVASQQSVAADQDTDDAVQVKDNLYHRLNATGSVQAIAIDDNVLFAGLQGGEIVVCNI